MIKARSLMVALALSVVLPATGCSSGGGSSAGSDLAELASPGSLVFVEGRLQPQGALKQNVDSVAKRFTGEDSLGAFVISELESSARGDGESFDFAGEVQPWLGERGGVAFERLIDGELSEPLVVVQSNDPAATQGFLDKRTEESSEPSRGVSYEGVDFQAGGAEGDAVGVIGDALVLADSEEEFKAAVDASQGTSLGGEDRFQEAISAASNGSFADVYVDVGGIIEQSKDGIDGQAREVLRSAGIDPSEATAVASVIPGSNQIEIDLSSDLGGEDAPSGSASDLLGSLPAGSLAAFAFSEFDEQLQDAIDNVNRAGIPPYLKPGELKGSLEQAGIDLDKIAASLEEGAVFAAGSNQDSLGGALVVTAGSGEAADAIADLGTLLRGARIPGVTAVGGKASGFSVRSDELGQKPAVVVARDDRIAIGYGLAPALAGLGAGSGATLSGTTGYKAAVAALGRTPISAYIAGPAALRLAEALVPRSRTDFWEAVPYLKKVSYIGLGAGTSDGLATAKLIAGIGE
jgi:hypothetical protein